MIQHTLPLSISLNLYSENYRTSSFFLNAKGSYRFTLKPPNNQPSHYTLCVKVDALIFR